MKEIRFARPEDIEEIIKLQKLIHKELEMPEKFDEDRVYQSINMIMVEPHYCIVAEVDGELVGCIGILVSPSMLNFEDFAGKEIGWSVKPEWKKEVGEELFLVAKEVAKQKGLNYIIGYAPKSKPQLKYVYEKLGGLELETSYKIEV